jgi:hypothetical protein
VSLTTSSPANRATVLVGDVAELLAAHALHGEHRLDVVHDHVRLALLVEHRLAPVLRLVVSVPLRREVAGLDELFRQRHHLERLRERLRRVDRQRADRLPLADLEETLLGIVANVAERAHGKRDFGLPVLADLGLDPSGQLGDGLDRDLVEARLFGLG